MILSNFNQKTKKREWTKKLSEKKDRMLIASELQRVGFNQIKPCVFLIEGMEYLDEKNKKQGILICEKTNFSTLEQEWSIFFLRWRKEEVPPLIDMLSSLNIPKSSTESIWEDMYSLWTESLNKCGDFSFLYKGQMKMNHQKEGQDGMFGLFTI